MLKAIGHFLLGAVFALFSIMALASLLYAAPRSIFHFVAGRISFSGVFKFIIGFFVYAILAAIILYAALWISAPIHIIPPQAFVYGILVSLFVSFMSRKSLIQDVDARLAESLKTHTSTKRSEDMGIFSRRKKVDYQTEKNKQFMEIEERFAESQENKSFYKAYWLTSRGRYFYETGKLNQAITDFKEAIKLNPDNVHAHICLAVAYRDKRMFEEALSLLDQALSQCSAYEEKREEYELTQTGATVELSTYKFDIYCALVSVYLQIGDKQKVIDRAKKALEAANDPKRREQVEFAKQTGLISERETDDSKKVKELEDLIEQLEPRSGESS